MKEKEILKKDKKIAKLKRSGDTKNAEIKLTPYNDPELEGTDKYFAIAIKKIFMSVPTILEFIHFNDKYPQNRNICITNRRTNEARIVNGKLKWEIVNANKLVDELITMYETELENYAEKVGNTTYVKEYTKAKMRGKGEQDLQDLVKNLIYSNSDNRITKKVTVQKISTTTTTTTTKKSDCFWYR